MSFFKRLKDKLIGNPTEEKVENLVEESSTELKLEDTVEPVQQESSHEELQEKVEESSASEDFIDSQASNVVEEEKQEEVQEIAIVEEPVKEKKPSAWSITQKFKAGLEKTRNSFTSKVNDLVARYRKVDEDFFEELEDLLLQADVGFETVMELMDKLRFEVQRKNIKDTNGIQTIISEKLVEIYEQGEEDLIELNMQPNGELTVILFVGVNGVGKTTTIGKLAHRLKSEGKTVVLAAGDTFRAGAIDQLQVWGDRVG
ncbi:Signal recognition particle receptor FtsY OS=Lysinibacillus sphaericus OX=1421 GN=ftsY PE=3 SV=1 [Lysinibacillus sphaericus]